MDTFPRLLVFLVIVLIGASLLYYLGAGRVPPPVRPVAHAWARAGNDPKWITVALWAVFAIIAVAFLLFVGAPMFHAVVDLGSPRR
jgi:hypothetical protein